MGTCCGMTNWEDTVMNPVERSITFDRAGGTLEGLCRKQAEISFKVGLDIGYKRGLCGKPDPDGVYENGKRDGIREVVEWVNNNLEHPRHLNNCYGAIDPLPNCPNCKWYAKLKEWGIEQPSP